MRLKLLHILMVALLTMLTACGGGGGGGGGDVVDTVSITTQPTDQSVFQGASATFSVTAGNAVSYQWQLSIDGGSSFVDIDGATSGSYTTPPTLLTDNSKQFRVVVNGASSSVISSAALLTVTAVVVTPSITVQPSDATVVEGQNASFSVTASGTSLSYQWQVSTDAGISFAEMASETSAVLMLTSVTLSSNGNRYRVVVSNGGGSVTSAQALLTVNQATATPLFTTHPADQAVTEPSTATFYVEASGTPSPTIQWQQSSDAGASWGDITGATSSSYTTAATTVADSGTQYRAVATNAIGTVNSNAATLTVNPIPIAPSFTSQPTDKAVVAPAVATFTVVADGTPTPALQWQISTDKGISWSNINGATLSSYTTPATSDTDDGKLYRVVASNSAAVTYSNEAVLHVVPAADHLVINEVDYDNVGIDTDEYIEIHNPTAAAIDLSGIRLYLINGAGNLVYDNIDLATAGLTLPAGGYLVVGSSTILSSVPSGAMTIVLGGGIQNGSPDGIALIDTASATLLDALSYEGMMTAVSISDSYYTGTVDLVEGAATVVVDSNVDDGSMSRCSNGVDTNDASLDWSWTSSKTPGEANGC